MTLVLTLNANSIWQAALALQCLPVVSTLAEATTPGQATLVATPVTLAELTTVLANSEQVLLAYEAPEAAIASLLQLSQAGDQAARSNNATPVQHAVQQWQQQITGLLTLQRQYRRKLKLLNLQQLAYASTEQLAELQPYWPLTQNVPAAATSIEQLAASQLLSQSPELSELNLLLQASSLALTELPPLDVQAVLSSAEQAKTQLTEQVTQLQQTLAQQQQQAEVSQQQTESRETELTQSIAAIKQQAELLQTEKLVLQQQLFDAQQQNKAQVADLKSENELLLSQLMQVQEELEQYYLASQQHKQQLEQQSAESKAQLQQLQTEVKALTSLNQQQADALTAKQQEISQQQNQLKQLQLQLTAQHAELEQAVTSQQQQKVALQQAETAQNELQAENELLLTQLMNVQEELERYYLNFVKAEELQQQLQQQLAEKQQQLSAEQQKQQQSSKALQQQQAQALLLQQQLRQLEQEKQRQHTLHIQQQKQQQREFSRLEQQFKKQKAELAGLKHSHLQLSTEFNAIRNSASWKVAAPVRLLTRAIKKVDKNKQRLQQDIGLLFTSEFFDADWYLNTYPDVKDAGANPAEHYLKFGAAEGRRPSAEFDGNWYLQRYPDVAQSGVNPLLHYIKFGRNEGRTASPKLLEDHSDQKTD